MTKVWAVQIYEPRWLDEPVRLTSQVNCTYNFFPVHASSRNILYYLLLTYIIYYVTYYLEIRSGAVSKSSFFHSDLWSAIDAAVNFTPAMKNQRAFFLLVSEWSLALVINGSPSHCSSKHLNYDNITFPFVLSFENSKEMCLCCILLLSVKW